MAWCVLAHKIGYFYYDCTTKILMGLYPASYHYALVIMSEIYVRSSENALNVGFQASR